MRRPLKERPLIFTGESVRAILEGRKSQTRRVLKIQPLEILLPQDRRAKSLDRVTRKWDGRRVWFALTYRGETISENRGCTFVCKHGEVGDRLWVREEWSVPPGLNALAPRDIWPPDKMPHGGVVAITVYREGYQYWEPWPKTRWRRAQFMPRWASRLTLEVTEVRVQRLQEISEEDAKAEGIHHDGTWWRGGMHPIKKQPQCWPTARDAFHREWDLMHAKRGHGWGVNPWVWTISFKRV